VADTQTMRMNEELTDLVRGRTIELVSKEGGLVAFLFNDLSTLRAARVGARISVRAATTHTLIVSVIHELFSCRLLY
jgi:hypothetical protein